MTATGAADVELTLDAANERALELYRCFGFAIVARTPGFALSPRASDGV